MIEQEAGGDKISAKSSLTNENNAPPAEIALNTTSDPSTLAPTRIAIEELAKRIGFDEKSVWNIGLCVNEAMANITRHAYGGRTDGRVDVAARGENDGIVIELRDWGSGTDPSHLPVKPPDPLRPGGLGLVCLRQLLDEVKFEPQPDGMRLTLVKKLKSDKTD
jgi:anti-sigma regulatory factor (Ser/Thr protein kinase)